MRWAIPAAGLLFFALAAASCGTGASPGAAAPAGGTIRAAEEKPPLSQAMEPAAPRGTSNELPETEETEERAMEKIELSDEEWRKKLSPEQYYILRRKGTERAFSGRYWDEKKPGIYACAGCGNPLFGSDTKFESGTGWPSFWAPVSKENVAEHADNSFFMRRTEVVCGRCGGHLGHVFDDGPAPTHLRYCINSAALDLVEKKETGAE